VQTLPENAVIHGVIHDYVKKRHSVSYPVAMTSDKRSFDRPLLVPESLALSFCDRLTKMVEVAGVEPASPMVSNTASTRLAILF